MCITRVHMPAVPGKARRGRLIPWNRNYIDEHRLPSKCLFPSSGPQQEQHRVLPTTALSSVSFSFGFCVVWFWVLSTHYLTLSFTSAPGGRLSLCLYVVTFRLHQVGAPLTKQPPAACHSFCLQQHSCCLVQQRVPSSSVPVSHLRCPHT